MPSSNEAIASLNAIVRMDTTQLDAGVSEAKRKLTGFEKGVNKSALSAESLGRTISNRMLSAGLAIGVTTAAVNKLNDAWREMQLNAGLPGQNSVSRGGAFVQGTRDFLEGIPGFGTLVKLGGNLRAQLDGSAAALKETNEQITRAVSNMTRLDREADIQFKRRQFDARIKDALSGNTLASEAFRRATEHPELISRELELEKLSSLRSRFDAVMDSLKSGTDRFTESQNTLKEALQMGLIPTLEQYERALSRLRQASGSAVEINTRTAIRRADESIGAAADGAGRGGRNAHAVLVQIRDILANTNSGTRLR